MPEIGRVLRFRGRAVATVLEPSEALSAAKHYLETAASERGDQITRRCIEQPDVVLSLCSLLKEQADATPALVAEEASLLYEAIKGATVGVFDEKQYFLGETALIAGGAYRLLGRTQESERWLDRAEAGFRHTVNPGPLMANVAYARLTLKFALGRFDEVLELLPSLLASFESLRMSAEKSKARYLEALALKASGDLSTSFTKLAELRYDACVTADPKLYGQILVHIGECFGQEGRFAEALQAYEEALPFVKASKRLSALAELKWCIGSTCRAQGRVSDAIDAFRDARSDFVSLGMSKYVVFMHLESADCLLELDRHREAEWELLAALPMIEEQKMVPEGFAAVALLKESVRRRKTDPNALRELREHLQASK